MSRYLQVLLVGVILGGLVVSAQVSTGTISGVVQDQSGASIAGAMVTVRNVDTGAVRTLTSDAGGRYTAPDLSLGSYEVQGQQSGFQTEVRSGITLTVGRESVVNLALKVGQISDKVTITAEAPLVESTTSAMSSLVDERTIRDLPLNGRSYDQLALLQPGVVSMGAGQASAAFDFGEGTRFSVTGSRPYANSFMLDGTDVNDHANGTPGGAAGTNLGVDGILEFKINTLVSPAEFGRSSGGVIAAVTRSGSNSLHGSAFGFLRNSALDSLGYFDESNHGNPSNTVAPYRRGQFGGSLGGPIKKDKTFYFGTYEGLRLASGTTQSAEVPTAATYQGILPFKAFQGTDPAPYNCHKGDTACVVPVSPAIKPFLNLFQAPNVPGQLDLGDGTGLWAASPLQVTDENYFMIRVDHEISEKTRIFLRYSFDKDSNVLPNVNGSSVANELDQARRQYSTIQVTSVLRPTLINSLRFGYNRTFQDFDDVVTDPAAAKLFFIPGQTLGTISFGTQGLNGSGGSGPLNFLGVDNGAPRIYYYNLFQSGDDLTYVRGRHSIKMGVDVKRIQDNELASGNGRGDYTFTDVPAFLANTPFRFDAPPPTAADAYRGIRETLFGAYVQDDIKMTQRFTLNLGLRYEALTNPTEVNGKLSDLLNIHDPKPTVLKDSLFSITKKDFEPRAGFAWQINGSGTTVVRAGFGMFHDHILPYAFATAMSGYPPYFTTLSDQTNPVFPIDTNLTNPNLKSPPLQFGGWLAENKEPSKIQYNLTLQQQVMKNTVLEIAYIGAESHHLQRNGEWNPSTPISPGVFPAYSGSTNAIAAAIQANRINPLFGSLTVARWDVNADYNALQVTLKHKTSSGLQYQAFYTYSKSIDQKSTLAGGESRQEPNTVLDFLNRARDTARSAFDARQNFVLTATYPFPFKFQQKFVGAILGGWTVNGISTFRTGEPFTGFVNSNQSQNGDRWNPDRPNLNPGFSPDPTSGVSAGCGNIAKGTPLGTPTLWYDPCAFSRPAPGTYGNLGRETITGPGLSDIDASIAKTFKPSERLNVQFRAEFFNLLNHANFNIPGRNVFAGSAGVVTKLISSPGGRLTQLGLKVIF